MVMDLAADLGGVGSASSPASLGADQLELRRTQANFRILLGPWPEAVVENLPQILAKRMVGKISFDDKKITALHIQLVGQYLLS